ncbi:MAG: hypothetical protein R3B09_14575 [Nannocystaceae bacterium]
MIRFAALLCTAGMTLGFATAACTPFEDPGECDANRPCTERGMTCDTLNKTCVEADIDVDQTAPPDDDGNFGPTILPFFRGKVCVAKSAKPGDKIPVYLSPCIHSCITASSFKQKHLYSCVGSSCDGLNLMWLEDATGAACPSDVFGRFDQSFCTYNFEITAQQGPVVIDGKALIGTMTTEIPVLSNEDMTRIAAGAGNSEIWSTVKSYPQDQDRVFTIPMNDSADAAPADCTTDPSVCDCRDIGF